MYDSPIASIIANKEKLGGCTKIRTETTASTNTTFIHRMLKVLVRTIRYVN